MNPGPVTLTSRVRSALSKEDLCHREPEFQVLQTEIRNRLVKIYEGSTQDYSAILLTGSGTAAVEAMIGSLIAPVNARALVLANGVYGDRIKKMLTLQGKSFESLDYASNQPLDMHALEAKLKTDRNITHVLAVHHETTTGRLNTMNDVGRLCKQFGAVLLLDAVSSFGGEEILFKDWNIGAIAATANKCLHGAPGISFVLVQKSIISTTRTHSPSLYLDLLTLHEAQQHGGSAFTQATHVCNALLEALQEFEGEGGWKARHGKYQRLSEQVRAGLAQLGITTYLASPSEYSSILTSFRLPKGLSYEEVHDYLKERGFIIYAGQGNLKKEMFRLAFMGALTSNDMSRLIDAFRQMLCA